MNFEDQLKNLTFQSRQKETLEKLQEEEISRIAQEKDNLLLKIKALIENEFKSVLKYYPNASIHPTHTIENGKVIPCMGTYYCCLLEFIPNQIYKIHNEYIIGIHIDIDNDLNIKLYNATIDSSQFANNKYAQIIHAFKPKKFIKDFYFEGSYNSEEIIRSTQKTLVDCLKKITS